MAIGANPQTTDLFDPGTFSAFVHPGEVIEIRAHHIGGNIASGYFDSHDLFCKAVREVDKAGWNVFSTLQVIDRRLLARRFNRMQQGKGLVTTSDPNVLAYRYLPVDIDCEKPSGISSSDSELKDALEVREQVTVWVEANLGFSSPIRAMSGNGYHLLYRLPDLPNTLENKALIKSMLEEIDVNCSTSKVKIDTTVFNPARIWKLYGTVARKGDEIPAAPGREARPHRRSYIESLGDQL